MAECHPVGFQWVMEAKRRGATIIHVDPRFTRTSAVADIHVPIRAGSDIVFLGAIVQLHPREQPVFRRVCHEPSRTRPRLSRMRFRTPKIWMGCSAAGTPRQRQYDPQSWQYKDVRTGPLRAIARRSPANRSRSGGPDGRGTSRPHSAGSEVRVSDFEAPLLALHAGDGGGGLRRSARAVPEGRRNALRAIRDANGQARSAMRWAGRSISVGVQYIRTAAIIQLLLGNIGRPGGGIMALRGHASIQGSTDIPTLYNLLPGYLPMPKASNDHDLRKLLRNNARDSGWWSEFPKYFVSLMKAWFGDAATQRERLVLRLSAHLTGDHSHMTTVADMADGKVKGYFVMGENPVVGSMNGPLHRKGMRQLDWLVVRDFALIETAEFWRDGAPDEIATEVFFFPGGGAYRKRRQLHQYAAAAAVASQGRRAARRIAAANSDFVFISAAAEGIVRRLDRSERPAVAGSDLGLSSPRRA